MVNPAKAHLPGSLLIEINSIAHKKKQIAKLQRRREEKPRLYTRSWMASIRNEWSFTILDGFGRASSQNEESTDTAASSECARMCD